MPQEDFFACRCHVPLISAEVLAEEGIGGNHAKMTTLRSLNLLLGFSASPFRRKRPRSFISLPKILPLFEWSVTSSPQSRQPSVFLLSRYTVHVKALQVSSTASPVVASPTADSAHKRKDKFCQFCGGLTKQVIPDGDEKMRAVCTVCRAIHYENPKMVVGCLVEHDGKILLCKRNIHPSYGLWDFVSLCLCMPQGTSPFWHSGVRWDICSHLRLLILESFNLFTTGI
ncbi:uncharacterized protein LOC110021215 [Phalaenopsis equestris]|uniref:uncharacterized protein LOC110021215 n=1 Tax=Phalaenopsis equestris TaxID=78828 RepID=UPI0009E4BF04|nr:uncharacterized protein LOC110021215 [Phalaenopsis equestris]